MIRQLVLSYRRGSDVSTMGYFTLVA